MQRDWDLIRKIMIEVERLGNTLSRVEPGAIEGSDTEITSYHIRLLIEAQLVKGQCIQSLDGPLYCNATSLTWEGHEFLDKIRSSTMWNRIKATAREKGLSMSFDAIKALAAYGLKAALS